MVWINVNSLSSVQFECGHCGYTVASAEGYFDDQRQSIYICPNCRKPTFFDANSRQYPGAVPGNDVRDIPEELEKLYIEARNRWSVSAFTASVLASRKC